MEMTDGNNIVTPALVRRIERFIVDGKTRDLFDGGGSPGEVGRFGQMVVINSNEHRWMNGVYCFGKEDLPRIAEILAFCGDANVPFHLSPLGFDEKVGAALSAAGFGQVAFEQTELFGYATPHGAPSNSDIVIERVERDTAALYAELHAQAFGWPAERREWAKEGIRRRTNREDIHAFIARYQGEPASVAVLEIRDRVASLQHGGTLPAFRGRGCQLALIRHRLHLAHQMACEFVIGGAAFNSISLRNQLRCGLQIAYIESTWTRSR
jgi:hypothetical protein